MVFVHWLSIWTIYKSGTLPIPYIGGECENFLPIIFKDDAILLCDCVGEK